MGSSGVLVSNGFLATSWVSVANITGTGTAVVSSAFIALPFPLVDFAEAKIEIRFSQLVTGGSGTCYAWTQIDQMQVETSVENDWSPKFITGKLNCATVKRDRKVIFTPRVVQDEGLGALADRFKIFVKAVGTTADTQFTVSDIKARILYKAL